MDNLTRLIYNKATSTHPIYSTYQDVEEQSNIDRINIFPYPFYFYSNPVKDTPEVYPRRAGWSGELYIPKIVAPPNNDFKPCFQAACNTTYTNKGKCTKNDCINVYR